MFFGVDDTELQSIRDVQRINDMVPKFMKSLEVDLNANKMYMFPQLIL